ncbi:hypothetical protein ACA910_016485 [Epithemia clementina (nom. ined.)]
MEEHSTTSLTTINTTTSTNDETPRPQTNQDPATLDRLPTGNENGNSPVDENEDAQSNADTPTEEPEASTLLATYTWCLFPVGEFPFKAKHLCPGSNRRGEEEEEQQQEHEERGQESSLTSISSVSSWSCSSSSSNSHKRAIPSIIAIVLELPLKQPPPPPPQGVRFHSQVQYIQLPPLTTKEMERMWYSLDELQGMKETILEKGLLQWQRQGRSPRHHSFGGSNRRGGADRRRRGDHQHTNNHDIRQELLDAIPTPLQYVCSMVLPICIRIGESIVQCLVCRYPLPLSSCMAKITATTPLTTTTTATEASTTTEAAEQEPQPPPSEP